MPNPLSRFYGEHTVCMGAGAAINGCPDLALLVVEVIFLFADAEAEIGSTLVNLLHPGLESSKDIIDDYIQAPNSQKQRQALLDVAKTVLKSERITELSALLRCFNTEQKRRNIIVHWTSGFSPQIADAILFEDPRSDISSALKRDEYIAESRKALEKAIDTNTWPPEQIFEPVDKSHNKIFVYKAKDFESMKKDMHALLRAFHSFKFLAVHSRVGGKTKPVHEHARDQLYSWPQFVQALEHLRRHPDTLQ